MADTDSGPWFYFGNAEDSVCVGPVPDDVARAQVVAAYAVSTPDGLPAFSYNEDAA